MPAGSSDTEGMRRATAFSLPLAPSGVYMDASRRREAGELLPRLFTLTRGKPRAVYLCCTFPGVASAGCCPALRPAVLGLSSSAFRRRGRPACSRYSVFGPTILALLSYNVKCNNCMHDIIGSILSKNGNPRYYRSPDSRLLAPAYSTNSILPQFSHSSNAPPSTTFFSATLGSSMLQPLQRLLRTGASGFARVFLMFA